MAQSAWRGASVRRRAAEEARQGVADSARNVTDSAAKRVQGLCRAVAVRRRLKAALLAAEYVDFELDDIVAAELDLGFLEDASSEEDAEAVRNRWAGRRRVFAPEDEEFENALQTDRSTLERVNTDRSALETARDVVSFFRTRGTYRGISPYITVYRRISPYTVICRRISSYIIIYRHILTYIDIY